jgi:hypothetical protein
MAESPLFPMSGAIEFDCADCKRHILAYGYRRKPSRCAACTLRRATEKRTAWLAKRGDGPQRRIELAAAADARRETKRLERRARTEAKRQARQADRARLADERREAKRQERAAYMAPWTPPPPEKPAKFWLALPSALTAAELEELVELGKAVRRNIFMTEQERQRWFELSHRQDNQGG